SISNPAVWRAAYATIIGAEGITGILFLLGAFRLFQLRNAEATNLTPARLTSSPLAFSPSSSWSFASLWFAARGSPFCQSATWNGEEAAFRFYVAVLGVLIFVNQRDVDL